MGTEIGSRTAIGIIASLGIAALALGAGLAPPDAAGATKTIYLKYSAKFVCEEPLAPGTVYYGPDPPLIRTSTSIAAKNPNAYRAPLYKRAVRTPQADEPPVPPGAWSALSLGPEESVTLDCDEISRMLTGNPEATFIGTYGVGVKVEGYVVLGVPAVRVDGVRVRYNFLDVFADYEVGSEVLKKDIAYQPFWWWWWWPLPWRLGYPYEVQLAVPTDVVIDYRSLLYQKLATDAGGIPTESRRSATIQALANGAAIDPTNSYNLSSSSSPALIALMGPVQSIAAGTAVVSFVLVSNKGSSDPDPVTGTPPVAESVPYPWVPGHLYNLPVVMPQNQSIDLDDFMRKWPQQSWIDAGADPANVNGAMLYYFPWWCGWNFWWGFDGSGCGEIGVGGGQSLDVEPIAPRKVVEVISVP